MRIILIEEKGSSESPAFGILCGTPCLWFEPHSPPPIYLSKNPFFLLFIYFYKTQFEGGGFEPWMSLLKTPIRSANQLSYKALGCPSKIIFCMAGKTFLDTHEFTLQRLGKWNPSSSFLLHLMIMKPQYDETVFGSLRQ